MENIAFKARAGFVFEGAEFDIGIFEDDAQSSKVNRRNEK